MKHDSMNLTAPHTARELAQADTEAGAMYAKRIATMIAEDAYLDRGEAGNPVSGTQAVQNLINAAQAVVNRWDSPLWGGSSVNLRHTGKFIADLRKALCALPAAQIGGAA